MPEENILKPLLVIFPWLFAMGYLISRDQPPLLIFQSTIAYWLMFFAARGAKTKWQKQTNQKEE